MSNYHDEPTLISQNTQVDEAFPSRSETAFPHSINKRYQCVKLIGRGSSGNVFHAYDQQLHREVAIKFIHRSNLQERKRLLAEGRVLAQLDHGNICRVYEVAEEGDAVYLVMSLIKGRHLDRWWEHFSLHQRVTLLAQIASALDEAHQQGIVHCDVKPSNIVLKDMQPGEKLQAVLVDFGIADSSHYAAQSGVGTEHYMAPERLDSDHLSPAVDIFSMGATLRRVLTGTHENASLTKLPRDLRLIIMKSLACLPGERYTSMGTLAEDLQAWLTQRPVSLRRSPAYRFKRLWQRSQWLRGTTLATATAGLLLFFASGLYQSALHERQLGQARMHEKVAYLQNHIDSIYRSPRHQTREELARLEQQAVNWASVAPGLPDWLAASHYSAAGRLFIQLDADWAALDALTRAWQLGDHSDITSMALARTHERLYSTARSQALNLANPEARQDALQAAHTEHRETALYYLDRVGHHDLPPDYVSAMHLYLSGEEAQALVLLEQGNFPYWFYPRYELGLALSYRHYMNVLVRGTDGNAEQLFEQIQYFAQALEARTPSAIKSYLQLASVYAETVRYRPAQFGDHDPMSLIEKTLAKAAEIDPDHPMYHRHLASLYTSQNYNKGDIKIANLSTRHYELALRHARKRAVEPQVLTEIRSSYIAALGGLQNIARNQGKTTERFTHRIISLSEQIPTVHQGASFYLRLAQANAELAQRHSGTEEIRFWQQAYEAAQNAYEIGKDIPTVVANVGILLGTQADNMVLAERLNVREQALQYLRDAHEKLPEQPAIHYNYLRAMNRLLFDKASLGIASAGEISQSINAALHGMENHPQMEFYRFEYFDLLNHFAESLQPDLHYEEYISKLFAQVDYESPNYEALRLSRQVLVAYRSYTAQRDNPVAFTELSNVLRAIDEGEHIRALTEATHVLIWLTPEIEHSKELKDVRNSLFSKFRQRVIRSRHPLLSSRFLEAATSSIETGQASDVLANHCSTNQVTPFAEQYTYNVLSLLERTAKSIEQHLHLPCASTFSAASIYD